MPDNSKQSDPLNLVLLHGFCEDSRIWEPLIPHLPASVKVFAPDLPGFGSAADVSVEPSIEAYARYVYDQCHDLAKAVVIGHSMGGYVSLALAEKYPAFIAGLGLCHSHPFADSEEKVRNRHKAVAFIRENGTTKFLSAFLPTLFAPDFARANPGLIETLYQRTLAYKAGGIINATIAMAKRKDRQAVLQTARYPVFFLLGRQDTALPLSMGLTQLSLAEEASIHIFDNSGHMAMFEEPEKTVEALLEFLDLIAIHRSG